MGKIALDSTGSPSRPGSPEHETRVEEESSTEMPEEIFAMLNNRRRRYALHYLLQEDGVADLKDLSTQVAAWENEIDPEMISYDQRRSVYTGLKQHHLPNMADADVLEYDDARGTIELTAVMDQFDIYIQVTRDERTIPWGSYHLGLGIVLTAFAGLIWIDLPPFGFIPPLVLAVVTTTVLLISGAAHLHRSRRARLGADGPPPNVHTHGISKPATS
jgi:hypothetical protein